jgi:hypothetical protein
MKILNKLFNKEKEDNKDQVSYSKTGISGYDELKEFLNEYMQSDETINILFVGGQASGKTRILEYVQSQYDDDQCCFYDFANTTGLGFIFSVVEARENQKIGRFKKRQDTPLNLFLDEVDKIKNKDDLHSLLAMLEGREINYNTKHEHITLKIPIRVYASANDISKLPKPFLSRFIKFELQDYSLKQFVSIAIDISAEYLKVKNQDRREEIAETIATRLYKKQIVDIRQVIKIMQIYNVFKGKKTVEQIIQFRSNYL